MTASTAAPGPPWYGVDEALLRRFEVHETWVHSLGEAREVVDLGDAVGLFDALDPDPFYNRIGAIRWPVDPTAFAERLAAALELFEARRRQPYVWLPPAGAVCPPELAERLAAAGFVEVGDGAIEMVLTRDPRGTPARPLPDGATIRRLEPGRGRRPDVAAATGVIAEVFAIGDDRRGPLEAEIERGLDDPAIDVRLVTIAGEPVAVGRRHDGGDLSYLSAIGVRRAWQGRGLGAIVTRALVEAALDAGRRWVYLGVYADNVAARALYEQVGFAALGGPALEFLRP